MIGFIQPAWKFKLFERSAFVPERTREVYWYDILERFRKRFFESGNRSIQG